MSHFKYAYFIIVLFSLCSSWVKAEQITQHVDLFEFHSVELQQRANALAKALRCPQCQNQNLVESNAQAAKDLRLKVYSMVNEGSTDQEVKDYLVQRYGNIVLYQPPFNYSTAALWIFPLLLLIFFILFSIKMIKRQ
ncbi:MULTISPECIES: heme lyase NrfEFG subunit NrfF [Vibrio]|jgi:cytochrome c nitrite reductase accessory protein NrfF|uniref:Formate-dependent nitrite reductase complex subunit n=2 Tax=Vibrio diabolicus subgroup TaxID=2315253 RepID=A0AAN2TM64_9VIBR|nr:MULTISPECIES: heme lyase NrfEFG subunit NrfF [Vibrio]MCR9608467.1 heme lyase NrfEFG subunit NrfF [Vibrio alginolyticus]RCW23560.1 cytochrome c-type biogenesis protein CcmH [Vibrio parahaemolyticus]GAJ77564.1 cytochrome c-type heme lyase subunit NrfF, nitrite reductase complex assembly [Vibrio sp. JCM 18905]ACY51280.1 cytochrome c-type heme lyase subunit nrfF nitrite reductase complex assembly [Vibrio antiquarius]AVF60506.1 heme lyase NrfEFG subunit NrfF [Vibrio diabolicus]